MENTEQSSNIEIFVQTCVKFYQNSWKILDYLSKKRQIDGTNGDEICMKKRTYIH